MNKLSQFLVEHNLRGQKPIKKVVVVYGGRFQPMAKDTTVHTNILSKNSVGIMFLSVLLTK